MFSSLLIPPFLHLIATFFSLPCRPTYLPTISLPPCYSIVTPTFSLFLACTLFSRLSPYIFVQSPLIRYCYCVDSISQALEGCPMNGQCKGSFGCRMECFPLAISWKWVGSFLGWHVGCLLSLECGLEEFPFRLFYFLFSFASFPFNRISISGLLLSISSLKLPSVLLV